jgi:hypothetical protein
MSNEHGSVENGGKQGRNSFCVCLEKGVNAAVGSLPLNNERLLWMGSL